MSKAYAYHFSGPPTAWIQSTYSRTWTDYKEKCLIRNITLSNQHKFSHAIGGKLNVDYVFTFDKNDLTKPVNQRPVGVSKLATLMSYIKYVDGLANGVLFNPSAIISITAKMVYDDIPKTEFVVTVLE